MTVCLAADAAIRHVPGSEPGVGWRSGLRRGVIGSGRRRDLLSTGLALGAAAALAPGRALASNFPPRLPATFPPDFVGTVVVPRYFPESGHNVDGELFSYFRANGGVETFGLPLTEEFWEPVDPDCPDCPGGTPGRMVQVFQRALLEYDLSQQIVQRGYLGELLLGEWQPAVEPLPGMRYFPETGHNLGGAFLRYFVEQGGQDTLGLPISEEVEEDGRPVQWFQHTRLEWWPENPPDRRVVAAYLGEDYLARVEDAVPEAVLAVAEPLPPLREWVLPPPPAGPLRAVAPAAIPILYYHQVPSGEALRVQIRAFKAAGRTIIPLAQVVAYLRGEGSLPPSPLVLTFDDGWDSQFKVAAPVLQAEGVLATFFVITRYLGTIPGYMSWDQVKALKDRGHGVESHTQNHPSLNVLRNQNEDAAIAEIWESLAILEERVGHSQRLFAYPNGAWDAKVAAITARLYRGAVATGGGDLQSQSQLYSMRRIKAEPSYSPESLIAQF